MLSVSLFMNFIIIILKLVNIVHTILSPTTFVNIVYNALLTGPYVRKMKLVY